MSAFLTLDYDNVFNSLLKQPPLVPKKVVARGRWSRRRKIPTFYGTNDLIVSVVEKTKAKTHSRRAFFFRETRKTCEGFAAHLRGPLFCLIFIRRSNEIYFIQNYD